VAPLRILALASMPPHPGGSAVCNAQLFEAFAAMGHDVRVLAAIAPEAAETDGHVAGVRITRFELPSFETSLDSPMPSAFRRVQTRRAHAGLASLIEAERPDVLVVGREPFAPLAVRLATTERIPCAVWIHGMPSQHLILGREYPAALARTLLRGLRHADCLVTASRHLAAGLERELGLEGVRVVPNPVNLERFSDGPRSATLRRQLGLDDDDVVVVHASNLKPIKRAGDIAESAEIALQADPRLAYVIVGDGRCREELEESCRRRGVAGRFRFAGWLPHPRVPEYLRLADIVVLPSEYENQALVGLETMACGRVLLASDVPASREIVDDGETGLLFRVGDTADLAAKTLAAAADPRLRARIGAAARAAVETHALDRIALAHERLLAALVDRTRSAVQRG
jgi:glycosyltransferase involved in cell wall biosynthesis